jgi:hypothetical protein
LGADHPVFTVGVGLLAYTFGLRHAFDADHIAAVDNATRKLIADNLARGAVGLGPQKKPLSIGFWFSLGHSTIVFLLAFALGRSQVIGRPGRGRRLPAAHRHRCDRAFDLRRLPVGAGHSQPRRAAGNPQGLP